MGHECTSGPKLNSWLNRALGAYISTFLQFSLLLMFFIYSKKDEDRANGNAMTSDRFREQVYDFWVSQDPNSSGKYICGTFDSAMLDELENMTKKK